MASSSGVQFNTSPHHCKECGLYLNSAESLEVHLHYHKENLLNKWAQAAAAHEETNNNNTKAVKREFAANTVAAADSSDSMKKSPEYSRTTPETIFGHPPTPQSYQSAASPYQNHDAAFSPSFQNYQIKQERTTSPQYNNYNFGEQFFMENQNQYQDFSMHKQQYRYHPYQYERQSQPQVSSSSPAYPPQPTPSPSPKQCDKCGFVCDSASQLLEHQNMAHASAYHHSHFLFNSDQPVKTEEDAQSEILDLDSHKVHQVYPEEEKRQNGELPPTPHSVSALLNTWSPPQKMYQQQYAPAPQDQKLYMHGQEFMNSVTTTSQEGAYRGFEPAPPAISSTPPQAPAPAPTTKSANWKSNEARRPKTYNCTACNKWFTSSGHLKRHYNTTLHKNAVKSSGQPDPASMPISAHHHPARDPVGKEEPASSNEEDTNSMPMMGPPIVSPPNGEAGPSPTTSLDSRGLLPTHHGFNMGHMPIEPNPQFQMYPNGSAPHVTQVTDTSSLSITGEEFSHQEAVVQQETQPLPSFAQFHRYGLLMGYGNTANVGGGGPATAPYCYYPDPFEMTETRTLMYKTDDDEYRLTVLTVADPAPAQEEFFAYENDPLSLPSPPSPEKAHTKRDYEEDVASPQISSTTVTSISTFRCLDCHKSFNKACYLTQHNKTFHCGDKPYKCDRCGKRFASKQAHAAHVAKHAGEKPHKCERCPKQFNHKTDLRRHMCLHTGKKPFQCATCGKGFIRKDHMLKHCETHFRKTNQSKMGK